MIRSEANLRRLHKRAFSRLILFKVFRPDGSHRVPDRGVRSEKVFIIRAAVIFDFMNFIRVPEQGLRLFNQIIGIAVFNIVDISTSQTGFFITLPVSKIISFEGVIKRKTAGHSTGCFVAEKEWTVIM